MKMSLNSLSGRHGLVLTALLSQTLFAYGESGAHSVIEEVVVTAQKRAESAQSVPVAISAFTESMAKNTGADTVLAIMPMIPGLTGSTLGIATNTWAIRGISSNDFTVGAESSVGVYLDDAYIGRNVLATAAYYDINRIEVVKGPQGTLFGRNSAAGAINIITNKPEQANYVNLGVALGDNGQQEYNVVANLASSDELAFRLAYHRKRVDGSDIFRNVNLGENAFLKRDDVRWQALWSPSQDFSALLTLNYSVAKDNMNGSYIPDLQELEPGREFPKRINRSSLERETSRTWGADLRLTWDLNETMTLTSITDTRGFEFDFREDVDATSDDALIDAIFAVGTGGATLQFDQPDVNQRSFAQELRLVGASEHIDWLVGASYFYEDVGDTTRVDLIDTALGLGLLAQDVIISNGDTKSVGLYGDATWHVTDSFGVTAGVRWSQDSKDWNSMGSAGLGIITVDSLGEKFGAHESWREWTSRLVINYQFSQEVMWYASVNQGYKGGGFNAGPLDFDGDGIGDAVASFDPETSTAYEAGLKSDLLERRLRFNLSTFFNKFDDLQVQTATLAGIITTNAAKAETKGVEIEMNYLTPIDGLDLSGNYTWLDAEFTAGDRDGNDLAFAPTVTWAVSLNYGIALPKGELGLWTIYSWQNGYYHDIDNMQRESGYGLWNARVSFQPASERWEVYVSADNINDRNYAVSRSDIGLGQRISRGFPRLVRAGFNYYFQR